MCVYLCLGICVLQDYYYIIVILMRNRFFYRSILYLVPLSFLPYVQFAYVCVWYNITYFLLSYPIEFTLTYNRSGLLSPDKQKNHNHLCW